MEPILKTDGLWKTYRSGKVEVSALRGVNFEVLPGEFVAVMGPSGCGKSTLLYVVGGLAQATRGRVLVDVNDLGAGGREQLSLDRESLREYAKQDRLIAQNDQGRGKKQRMNVQMNPVDQKRPRPPQASRSLLNRESDRQIRPE